MPAPKPARRPRNTTRQKEAGAAARAETRRRLLQAAGEEFALHGYTRATVARIAARAGVTVQTLYLAWGSKVALLRAYLERALAGPADGSGAGRDIEAAMAQLPLDTIDPAAGIARFAAYYREVAERAALGWQLYRDAAATDPEVAADWHQLQSLRHGTFERLIARIASSGLRPDITTATAVDTAWAIASPDTYDLLVRHRGYTMDQYQTWVRNTLTAALLDPAGPAEAPAAAPASAPAATPAAEENGSG